LRNPFTADKKSRVYLNSLGIVERKDKSFLDRWAYPEYRGLNPRLEKIPGQVVTLPLISERTGERANDLAIDVAIPEYQTGFRGYLALEYS
jgi:hypothetical protein